ncbi:hypothetical protein DFH08DRAFT_1011745 [Mycena albidolilacea]|uniref:F-box domain-containing protein n=1 Tax=Mycena albidolilacea TaxID=1033008 RepID=A0AAD7EMV4_9AGAR|nr:hypothetical protein DFH08DRAFT_1011745 [Mycena albidolilacea]
MISDDENRILLMDAEIIALETKIHNLNANLTQSLQKRNDAAIFELLHDGKAGTRPPWYFGHISQSWRHTALSLEQLWSFIVVGSPPSAKSDALVASIEVQLQRSAHVPLDIYFPDVRSEMDSRVLDLVLPRCNRWRSLCLDRRTRLPECNVVLDWLRPVEGHLDQLVKLEARHYWIAIPDIFSTTPRLREVILTNNRRDESSSFIVIPWRRITHYRGTFSSERQLQTLTIVPRLVECTLGFRGALNLVPPITATLPNLRRLSLDMHTAVQNITAPVLEDLILFSGTRRELSWILPFLPPCSSTLRRLALRQSTICLELIPVLRALPLLAHLVFEYDSGNNAAQIDFFTALSTTNATSDSFICPNLTSFIYRYRFRGRSSEVAFFAMAVSRFRPNSDGYRPLLRLRLYAARYTPLENDIQIKLLQDQGFDAAFLDEREAQLLSDNMFVF